jgi:hypothetical protein
VLKTVTPTPLASVPLVIGAKLPSAAVSKFCVVIVAAPTAATKSSRALSALVRGLGMKLLSSPKNTCGAATDDVENARAATTPASAMPRGNKSGMRCDFIGWSPPRLFGA